MTRRRKFLFTGCVCGVVALLGLVLAELYIRCCIPLDESGWYELVDDPILFYRFTAEKEGEDLGKRRTQTAQRLRGPFTYSEQPAPGVHRLLWLGDSACFATGVADEETAAYRLYELATAAGVSLESINLAVVGYNVRQVREVLARRSAEFQGVSTVVYYHHENDIVNAPWVALAPHLPSKLYRDYDPPQAAWKKVLKRSALVHRLARTQWFARQHAVPAASFDPSEPPPMAYYTRLCASLYTDGHAMGRQFRDELYAMADLVEPIGARFILVYWPTQTIRGHDELDRVRSVMRNWCAARNIHLLDVTDAFLAGDARDLYLDPIHPSPDGQRIIAEAVWAALGDGRFGPPNRVE